MRPSTALAPDPQPPVTSAPAPGWGVGAGTGADGGGATPGHHPGEGPDSAAPDPAAPGSDGPGSDGLGSDGLGNGQPQPPLDPTHQPDLGPLGPLHPWGAHPLGATAGHQPPPAPHYPQGHDFTVGGKIAFISTAVVLAVASGVAIRRVKHLRAHPAAPDGTVAFQPGVSQFNRRISHARHTDLAGSTWTPDPEDYAYLNPAEPATEHPSNLDDPGKPDNGPVSGPSDPRPGRIDAANDTAPERGRPGMLVGAYPDGRPLHLDLTGAAGIGLQGDGARDVIRGLIPTVLVEQPRYPAGTVLIQPRRQNPRHRRRWTRQRTPPRPMGLPRPRCGP